MTMHITDPTIEIDGITYVVELKEANHGFHHWHDEDHPDGTPGQPAHHHHDEKCAWRPAMLKPVDPAEADTDHIAAHQDEDVRVTLKLYPEEVDMLHIVVSDQVEDEGDDWDYLLTAITNAQRRMAERRAKAANRENR